MNTYKVNNLIEKIRSSEAYKSMVQSELITDEVKSEVYSEGRICNLIFGTIEGGNYLQFNAVLKSDGRVNTRFFYDRMIKQIGMGIVAQLGELRMELTEELEGHRTFS